MLALNTLPHESGQNACVVYWTIVLWNLRWSGSVEKNKIGDFTPNGKCTEAGRQIVCWWWKHSLFSLNYKMQASVWPVGLGRLVNWWWGWSSIILMILQSSSEWSSCWLLYMIFTRGLLYIYIYWYDSWIIWESCLAAWSNVTRVSQLAWKKQVTIRGGAKLGEIAKLAFWGGKCIYTHQWYVSQAKSSVGRWRRVSRYVSSIPINSVYKIDVNVKLPRRSPTNVGAR